MSQDIFVVNKPRVLRTGLSADTYFFVPDLTWKSWILACYHALLNLLLSQLLPKNVKIKNIQNYNIACFYGCET
jgi:hypothetical protein